MNADPVKCCGCGTVNDVRASVTGGAYGTVVKPYCQSCYAKEAADYAADMKRCGFRGRMKSWSKLQAASLAPWIDS